MIDAKTLFTAFLTNVLFKESFKLGILYVRSLWASNNKDKMETLVIVWTESCTHYFASSLVASYGILNEMRMFLLVLGINCVSIYKLFSGVKFALR